MPYKLRKKSKGYKVCVPNGKCFSKKPLSRKKALGQLAALKINTNEGILFNALVEEVLTNFS